MSKRVATTITLSVRIPLPPGLSVKATVDSVKEALFTTKTLASLREQIIIRVAKRETTYL